MLFFHWRVTLQYTNMAGWKIMKNTSSNDCFFHGHVSFFGGCNTLQGTNISPKNGILKMIFLFLRWDMLSFPGGYTFNGFVASATPGAEALQVESLWSSFGRKKVVGFFW